MGIFDHCLLVSDIDGTLMTNQQIPQRNIEAIEYFKSEGGLFTIASGRSPDGILPVHKLVQCNAPVLAANGAMLYDFLEEKLVYIHHLPNRVKQIVDELYAEFPMVGYMAIDYDKYYVMHRNFGVDFHKRYVHIQDEDISFEDCKQKNWVKLLMITNNALQTNALCHYAQRLGYNDDVYFLRSDPMYLEMTDITVNKGNGVKQLVKHLKNIKHIYTIGDFDNDLEMLAVGELSSAVAESPQKVKNAASVVSGPCAGGAVADFIAYLKQKHLSQM